MNEWMWVSEKISEYKVNECFLVLVKMESRLSTLSLSHWKQLKTPERKHGAALWGL